MFTVLIVLNYVAIFCSIIFGLLGKFPYSIPTILGCVLSIFLFRKLYQMDEELKRLSTIIEFQKNNNKNDNKKDG